MGGRRRRRRGGGGGGGEGEEENRRRNEVKCMVENRENIKEYVWRVNKSKSVKWIVNRMERDKNKSYW